MGSIDRPARAEAKPRTEAESLTFVGWIAVSLGVLIFAAGAFMGGNLFAMGIGAIFCAAGAVSKKSAPSKLCPACQMAIPKTATICGHCRTAIPG